jgi:hypothetical protein
MKNLINELVYFETNKGIKITDHEDSLFKNQSTPGFGLITKVEATGKSLSYFAVSSFQ